MGLPIHSKALLPNFWIMSLINSFHQHSTFGWRVIQQGTTTESGRTFFPWKGEEGGGEKISIRCSVFTLEGAILEFSRQPSVISQLVTKDKITDHSKLT